MQPGTMEWIAAREVVRYGASLHIMCKGCGDILDQSRTIVASDGDRATLVLCARCWNKSPGNFKSGSVEVFDGRTLFARAPRRKVRK